MFTAQCLEEEEVEMTTIEYYGLPATKVNKQGIQTQV
jgi:hypothetical protein